jgi:hypothetical protein
MGAKARPAYRHVERGRSFRPSPQLWNQVTLKLLPRLPRLLGAAFV